MPDPIDISQIINRSPEQIVKWFRDKGYTISWNWQETWQDAHARAFTVAKAMNLDILQSIREAVDEAIADGQTFREFQQGIEPVLKKKGWWGKVPAKDVPGFDPTTGDDPEAEVQLGSPWRLKTIYRTNLQTSMMTGRYQGHIENAGRRPFWEYVAVMDRRTRPSHAALNGKVYRYDDPFWETFYPPNGWNCRCRVRTRSQRDIERENLVVEDSAGRLYETDQPLSSREGDTIRATGIRVRSNGKDVRVIPDAGWGYNPGRAAYAPRLENYDPATARQFVSDLLESNAFARFYENPAGSFPVAVLQEAQQRRLSSRTPVATLTGGQLANIKHGNPQLKLDDYKQLQRIIEGAEVIIELNDVFLAVLKSGRRYYIVTLQRGMSSVTDNRLLVTYLEQGSAAEVHRLRREGTIIYDQSADNAASQGQ